ncbi:hypothetical protein QV01_08160 [Gallibacterium genomosp. 3]|uniref:Uncharacterized protein n=1 Tax=Gallibacterium genomosp. 3 TaxID=505345 RepID=A0A1A7NME9_9PAST|nr:hypothetical protein [Gallibacterium genomosp. 3]OBW91307.1 hypothetical protein QV01_08160 [Gallibacterium genomosp. 3]
MKELFRANLYVADCDSVNSTYDNAHYTRRFKSGILMAKSIGMNPNMIFDSQGFEMVISDPKVKKFFAKKVKEKEKEGLEYCINVHIYNNFIEDGYFDFNAKENPFERYYHEKLREHYLFSSYHLTKQEIEKDTLMQEKIAQKLTALNEFVQYIYQETGNNIFKIRNDNAVLDLRSLLLNRSTYMLTDISKFSEMDENFKKIYIDSLQQFKELIEGNIDIKSRSQVYHLLETMLAREFSEYSVILKEKLKTDIIDISYNSSFIKEGEIFRYKSIDALDIVYEKLFDSYADSGILITAYNLYKTIKKIKSKIEILDLVSNPAGIVNYLVDELLNEASDRGVSAAHKAISYLLPKTRLLGVAESKNLLIGVKASVKDNKN